MLYLLNYLVYDGAPLAISKFSARHADQLACKCGHQVTFKVESCPKIKRSAILVVGGYQRWQLFPN